MRDKLLVEATVREEPGSLGQKLFIASLHAAAVGLMMTRVLGASDVDAVRGGLVAGCAAGFFVRHSAMLFARYERTVTWAQAVSAAMWLVPVQLMIAYFGSRTAGHLSMLDVVALELYLVGSYASAKAWHHRTKFARSIGLVGEVMGFCGIALLVRSLVAFAVIASALVVTIPGRDR